MPGSGVQVVEVESGSYRLDVEALERILLRDPIKDLPVVVVSVAGAYRGGKSFLLNFFPRYIEANDTDRLNGLWLGAEHAPLEGFSWRGGSERNTTGIVIWSEPFTMTLHTGKKVCVILMDTQGTFDSSSTVKDCSTIFALSTLLSSVQIYNLSQNIGEDNLQHLQLFTEYGRLINDTNSKAFQTLEFLVRDWQHVSEYPYGSTGGNLYLENKLRIKPDMNKELIQLREHIKASFEIVSCFLMPHPGLEVIEPDFQGELIKLSPKFKQYIKELTCHIFGPARLKPKEIGGREVTASGLFTYFKTYMNLFNSDGNPTPTNIMQATAEAGFLSAFEESRCLYESGMESECGPSRPSLSPHDFKHVHETHAQKAAALFTAKKKMGSKHDSEKYLRALEEESKTRSSQFAELNIGKIQKTIMEAKELYENRFGQIKGEQMLLVHPLDLKALHDAAVKSAVEHFDKNRRNFSKTEDKEKAVFVNSFEKQYDLLKLINDRNHNIVIEQLILEYWQTMMRKCSADKVSDNDFQNAHQEALVIAVDSFNSRRRCLDCHYVDEFKCALIEKIQDCFTKMRDINKSRNKADLHAAIRAYDDHMASAWDSKRVCLHPGDLIQEHDTAMLKAMTEFRPTRVSSGELYLDKSDDDEKLLAQVTEDRYNVIRANNESANAAAVTAAVNLYSDQMYYNCGFSVWWIVGLGVPWIINLSNRQEYHDESKGKALKLFWGSRRESSSKAFDKFMEDLEARISDIENEY